MGMCRNIAHWEREQHLCISCGSQPDEYAFMCEACGKRTYGKGEMPQYPNAVCEHCGHTQERQIEVES